MAQTRVEDAGRATLQPTHDDDVSTKMMGMPFRSEKQRRYMFANEPEIAERWTKKYGSKPVGVKKAVVMRPSPGTSTFSSAVLPALRERRKKPYQYIMSPGRAGSQKIQERIERRIKDPKIISESMEDPYQGSLELAEFLASRGLFDDMSVDDRLYLQSYLSRPGETYAASKKDVAAAMPERRREPVVHETEGPRCRVSGDEQPSCRVRKGHHAHHDHPSQS